MSFPFFKSHKKGAEFSWMDGCECSFQELKAYLGKSIILSKLNIGETLSLYLAISEAIVSVVLIHLEANVELLVFYVSWALLELETRYSNIEKMALSLVVVA